jgi:hypothetical protein
MSAMLILAMIIMTIGWWLLTRPDPSGLGEDQYGGARKTIRVAQVAGVIQMGLNYLSRSMTMSEELLLLIQALVIGGAVAVAVGIFAECAYLEKLATRIPDDRLSRRAHFLMWALGSTYGLMQLIAIVLRLTEATGGQRGDGFSCFMGILYLTVLVFFVMLLLLLGKMGRRFKEAARAARQTWASQAFAGTTAQAGEGPEGQAQVG